MSNFTTYLMAILVLTDMVFVIIWEMFHGKISLNSVSAAANEFCEWIQVGNHVYIPRHKYQVISPHSSLGFLAACAAAKVHRNHIFRLYQLNKTSKSKRKFRQASNCYNNPKKLSKQKAKFKAKLFAKNFLKNSIFDDSGISLPVLPSRTNVKLHNISVTPQMVKKAIKSLDLSKVSGPDCIPVVVLNNCESGLSCVLAELFNMCLQVSYFPNCWKVSSMVPVLKNAVERSTAKNTVLLVFFL